MKYLYLIIRHIWPRKRWKLIVERRVLDMDSLKITAYIRVYEDQFGNMRKSRINA